MPSEQSWQNPLAEQSALPLQCLLQFIEEAPIGTSDNGHYVAHALLAVMGGDGPQRIACTTTPREVTIMAVIRSRAGVETSLYDQALPG
jgi:hypothetical protein